jgi:tetrahydromethanopterin S-methyltransferase subunit F
MVTTCRTNCGKEVRVSFIGGKARGKKSIEKIKTRVNDIKMDLGVIGRDSVDSIGLTQETGKRKAFVNAVMNFRVP